MEMKKLLVGLLVALIGTMAVCSDYYDEYYGEDYNEMAYYNENVQHGDFFAEVVSTPFTVAEEAGKAALGTAGGVRSFFEREVLSGPDRFIRRSFLDPSGLSIGYNAKTIYAQNVKGGISTHRKAGRFSGDYNIEIAGDMEKFFGLKGGLYMNATGAWSKSGGINGPAVGSLFGVGGGGSRRGLDVEEFWYEQAFFNETLRLRLGKLDLSGGFECRGCPVSFDGNSYANSSASQFLNGAFKNNPQLPFPDPGLGVMAYWNPWGDWYLGFGVGDADADERETGFSTTFDGDDNFIYMVETGITPQLNSANGSMQGAYRVGIWVDGTDKKRFSDSTVKNKDLGVYISCDQMVYKENSDEEDDQGIGVFGRWGYADSDLNKISQFISGGAQYRGVFEGRDDDVMAFGVAYGILSDQAGAGFTEDNETAFEAYYNAVVAANLTLTPSIQYIKNTGGNGIGDTVVLAVRAYMMF